MNDQDHIKKIFESMGFDNAGKVFGKQKTGNPVADAFLDLAKKADAALRNLDRENDDEDE